MNNSVTALSSGRKHPLRWYLGKVNQSRCGTLFGPAPEESRRGGFPSTTINTANSHEH